MSAAAAQVWCSTCQHEVIVAVRPREKTASCPWCDRRIRVPKEAVV